MPTIDTDKYKNKYCDIFLDLLVKCNTTENIDIKKNCVLIEKMLNSSWIDLYNKCKKIK